jgi:capsular exopolysaccharide synthesis family protein
MARDIGIAVLLGVVVGILVAARKTDILPSRAEKVIKVAAYGIYVVGAILLPWVGGTSIDSPIRLRSLRVVGAVMWGIGLSILAAVVIPWLGTTPYGQLADRFYTSMVTNSPWPLFSALATLPALVLIWVWRTAAKDEDLRISQESQIMSRFVAAADLLGKGEDVQVAGLHALERIARDSPPDREAVRKTLAEFVATRQKNSAADDSGARTRDRRVVRAALSVLRSDLFLGPGGRRVTSLEDLSTAGLPVMGQVPETPADALGPTRSLAELSDPVSRLGWSLWEVARNFRFSAFDPSTKAIVITSCNPGDGKTTVAANLSRVLSVTERVLLLECDLRRPTLRRHFELGAIAPGLTEVLAERVAFDKAIHHPAPPEFTNLDVLTSGSLAPDPEGLLRSDYFRKFVREISTRYDRVIIDTPPVSVPSDAYDICSCADACVLVVRFGKTRIGSLVHALRQLETQGIQSIWGLVNRVAVSKSDARYLTYYYKGHPSYTAAVRLPELVQGEETTSVPSNNDRGTERPSPVAGSPQPEESGSTRPSEGETSS